MALMGIDARVERTRHQVNYPETYDLIFKRVHDELGAAAGSDKPIKHLIVLLGIPIAYPVCLLSQSVCEGVRLTDRSD
jgi:hypothetical protein